MCYKIVECSSGSGALQQVHLNPRLSGSCAQWLPNLPLQLLTWCLPHCFMLAWLLQEADAKMGLDMWESYWGKCLWRIKKEGTEVGRENSQVTMQVWHLWEERKKDSLGRKSLRQQHSSEKVLRGPRGVPQQNPPSRGVSSMEREWVGFSRQPQGKHGPEEPNGQQLALLGSYAPWSMFS